MDNDNNQNEAIRRPFQAYAGTEPYMFISYAHKDAEIIFSEIKKFHDEGYNVWYDQGLTPGKEWDEEIAEALIASSLVILFVSENSIKSKNVRNEINLALNEDIDVVHIYLEETQLSPGLKLQLTKKHAIFKYSLTDADYLTECFKAFESANLPKNNDEGMILVDEFYEDSSVDAEIDVVILLGCSKIESLVFRELCDYCLDNGFDAEIDPMTILNLVSKYYDELDYYRLQEKIAYSLRNLERNDYINVAGGSVGMAFLSKSISSKGFYFYLNNLVEDKAVYSNVVRAMLVDELSTIEEISIKYDIRRTIVENLVKLFRREGYIVCKNDLTDIGVTPAGEMYFAEIIN